MRAIAKDDRRRDGDREATPSSSRPSTAVSAAASAPRRGRATSRLVRGAPRRCCSSARSRSAAPGLGALVLASVSELARARRGRRSSAQPAAVPSWSASRIVGSAPSSSSASTASRRPAWAARWSAVTPSPWSGPPKVPRWFTSAPSSTSLPDDSTRPFAAAQVSARAAVGVGVDARAELDEELEHLDAVALRRPDERLVEHLLRVVGRLPRREAAVRAVEGAVGARLRASRQLADQLGQPEPGGDAQVAAARGRAAGRPRGAPRRAPRSAACRRRRAPRGRARPPASSMQLARAPGRSSSRPGGASSSRSRCRGSGRRRARAAGGRARGVRPCRAGRCRSCRARGRARDGRRAARRAARVSRASSAS